MRKSPVDLWHKVLETEPPTVLALNQRGDPQLARWRIASSARSRTTVPDGGGSVRGTLRVSTTGTTHTLVVEAGKAGQRVDLFIGEALGLSRAKLKKLFESGAVKVEAARRGRGCWWRPGSESPWWYRRSGARWCRSRRRRWRCCTRTRRWCSWTSPRASRHTRCSRERRARWRTRWWRATPSARRPRRTSARAGCATGWTSRPPG